MISSSPAQSVSSMIGGISATPTKASPASVFWNPAVISASKDFELETNLALVGGWFIYDRTDENPNDPRGYESTRVSLIAPNPFLSVATPVFSRKFHIGYATYFPTGIMANLDEEGSQRYDIIGGKFIPWTHQFSLSFSPNPKFSIAAAFIYSYAFFHAELDADTGRLFSSVLGLSEEVSEHPSLASRVRVPHSTDHSFGGLFGMLYRPNVQWSFGLSFLLPQRYLFKQDIQFRRSDFFQTIDVGSEATGIEQVGSVESEVEMESPAILSAGFRYQPYGYWTGEYFGRYIFSSFTRTANVRFKDSSLINLRGQENMGVKRRDAYFIGTTQSFRIWKPFIAGLLGSYHWNGVDDRYVSTTRIDFNTLNIGLFTRYSFSNNFELGAEYSHSFMMERQIKDAEAKEFESLGIVNPVSTNGNYRASADRLALSLRYEF